MSELVFSPENIDDISDITEGTEILNASISRGEKVINIDLIVKHQSDTLYCTLKESKEDYLDLVNILFV